MTKRLLYHIAFWAGYVLFKTYLNHATSPEAEKGAAEWQQFIAALVPQTMYLLVKIPLVYFLFWVIERYFAHKWSIGRSILIGTLAYLIATIGYVFITHVLILNWLYGEKTPFQLSFVIGSLVYSAFTISAVCGAAITIKLIRMNLRQKALSQEIMQKKLETELNLLRSQVNPHFLFNTLNNIYALAKQKSDETGPVVLKLSKLLRFMLYESDKERIALSDEVRLVTDFIELENLRYGDHLTLDLLIDITNPHIQITPLLLLPLVENAFKHGASESRDAAYIYISISEEHNLLSVEIKNSVEQASRNEKDGGIGLKNVRRQLELTYSDFKLDAQEHKGAFLVTLSVNLLSYKKIVAPETD